MKISFFLTAFFLFIFYTFSYSQTIRYVKNYLQFDNDFEEVINFYYNVGGNWDFLSWETAAPDLQSAINASEPGDIIYVQKGNYMPAFPLNYLPYINFEDIEEIRCYFEEKDYYFCEKLNTFTLHSGVRIYGGFEGWEINTEERDIYNLNNKSILNGLLSNNEKVYHVVSAYNCNESTVLDGFTVTNGDASFYNTKRPIEYNCGGGIYSEYSSVKFKNLIITGNNAFFNGGGFYETGSSSTILNTIIWNNCAGFGAGIYITYKVNKQSATIVGNTLISGNRAHYRGAGVYNMDSNPVFVNTTISANNAMRYLIKKYEDMDDFETYGYDSDEKVWDDVKYKGGGIYNATESCSNFSPYFRIYNSIVLANGTGLHYNRIIQHQHDYPNVYSEGGFEYGNCLFGTNVSGEYYEVSENYYNIGVNCNPFILSEHYDTAPLAGRNYGLSCCCELDDLGFGSFSAGSREYYYQYIGDPELDTDLKGNPRLNKYNELDTGAYTFISCDESEEEENCIGWRKCDEMEM